jgi:hypothetical protein
MVTTSEVDMDHTTMWRANERTIEARQKASEDRLARAVRQSDTPRSLLQRIRGGR